MTIRRVGKEVSAQEYWSQRSEDYNSHIDGAYHTHRMAMVKSLLKGCDIGSRTCVDLGCGDGVLLEYLASQGGHVIGCDASEVMVEAARKRLSRASLEGEVSIGGVEALRSLVAHSIDYLLAINVMSYFSGEEAELFYSEAARVLKEKGSLIITHSNELFDMYTLNLFTAVFYEEHFCGPGTKEKISSLLTHPDKPERIWFNIRENPLSYRYKLADYGFDEVQQEFANIHHLPPLLMDPEGFVDIDKREYPDTLGWDERERWKLMFMCSMFGIRAIKR